jgi:hypothetical protein
VDGFLIQPSYLPRGLDEFVDLVIPELQSRGSFRTEYEATTLRANLGLARPESRYADIESRADRTRPPKTCSSDVQRIETPVEVDERFGLLS